MHILENYEIVGFHFDLLIVCVPRVAFRVRVRAQCAIRIASYVRVEIRGGVPLNVHLSQVRLFECVFTLQYRS